MARTAALPYFPTCAHDEYDQSEVISEHLIASVVGPWHTETRTLFVQNYDADLQFCEVVRRVLEH